MRFAVSLLLLCTVVACAPITPDPNAEATFYDNRTTTGSNIPRKSTGAVVVDKSIVQDQVGRQGGSLQR